MHSPASLPHDLRANKRLPVRLGDHTGKPVLHIIPQGRIDCQLRRLGPSGGPISVPLCRGRSVLWSAVAARHIAPELARDCAWRPINLTSYGSHPMTLRVQDGDLLTFGKREVALRWR